MWEDQRIVARTRYRDLIAALRFVARQELIFGQHVHVGVDDPDKAIHVANGMRVHMPLLLALSANSPFWRAQPTGLLSTRTPIFRAFPRVGIPPAYKDWEEYAERIRFMSPRKVIEDYTYLWYDVRPHPNFGTVEMRVMDSQTRIEHTLGLAALVQALVKELCEHYDAGKRLSRYPYEMLDENKWLAARHGLDGELVDLPKETRVPHRELVCRVLDRVREHAQDLGSTAELEGDRGPARARQRRLPPAGRLRGQPRPPRGRRRDRREDRRRPGAGPSRAAPAGYPRTVSEPDLFVVCKNCSSEVSPYVTECPYCGQRVRKRAPKIERGAPRRSHATRRRRPRPPTLGRLRRDEIPGIAPETRPYATGALIVRRARREARHRHRPGRAARHGRHLLSRPSRRLVADRDDAVPLRQRRLRVRGAGRRRRSSARWSSAASAPLRRS